MPRLTSNLLSNWYFFTHLPNFTSTETILMLENWKQTEQRSVSHVANIQGVIGTRVVNVPGIIYNTRISADHLISHVNSPFTSMTPLNLIADCLDASYFTGNELDRFYLLNRPNSIMQSASINIQDTVGCEVDIISDVPDIFAFYDMDNVTIGNLANIYRTARKFDCKLLVPSKNIPGYSILPVISGNINITANVLKNFFINESDVPQFLVGDYEISGTVQYLVEPAYPFTYLSPQFKNEFNYDSEYVLLRISNNQECFSYDPLNDFILYINSPGVFKSISKNLSIGSVTQGSFEFISHRMPPNIPYINPAVDLPI